MAKFPLTTVEQAAAARSVAAQTAARTLKRAIDNTVEHLAARVGELAADVHQLSQLVGTDSTRPGYTRDLQALNRQRVRLAILLDALKQPEL